MSSKITYMLLLLLIGCDVFDDIPDASVSSVKTFDSLTYNVTVSMQQDLYLSLYEFQEDLISEILISIDKSNNDLCLDDGLSSIGNKRDVFCNVSLKFDQNIIPLAEDSPYLVDSQTALDRAILHGQATYSFVGSITDCDESATEYRVAGCTKNSIAPTSLISYLEFNSYSVFFHELLHQVSWSRHFSTCKNDIVLCDNPYDFVDPNRNRMEYIIPDDLCRSFRRAYFATGGRDENGNMEYEQFGSPFTEVDVNTAPCN